MIMKIMGFDIEIDINKDKKTDVEDTESRLIIL